MATKTDIENLTNSINHLANNVTGSLNNMANNQAGNFQNLQANDDSLQTQIDINNANTVGSIDIVGKWNLVNGASQVIITRENGEYKVSNLLYPSAEVRDSGDPEQSLNNDNTILLSGNWMNKNLFTYSYSKEKPSYVFKAGVFAPTPYFSLPVFIANFSVVDENTLYQNSYYYGMDPTEALVINEVFNNSKATSMSLYPGNTAAYIGIETWKRVI